MTMGTNTTAFNEGEALDLVSKAVRHLLIANGGERLPHTTEAIITSAVISAYQIGRKHEKDEQELITEATTEVLGRTSDARVRAVIAGVMHGEQRTALTLNLAAVREVFKTHRLVVVSVQDGLIHYELEALAEPVIAQSTMRISKTTGQVSLSFPKVMPTEPKGD